MPLLIGLGGCVALPLLFGICAVIMVFSHASVSSQDGGKAHRIQAAAFSETDAKKTFRRIADMVNDMEDKADNNFAYQEKYKSLSRQLFELSGKHIAWVLKVSKVDHWGIHFEGESQYMKGRWGQNLGLAADDLPLNRPGPSLGDFRASVAQRDSKGRFAFYHSGFAPFERIIGLPGRGIPNLPPNCRAEGKWAIEDIRRGTPLMLSGTIYCVVHDGTRDGKWLILLKNPILSLPN